ncbi:radical SAM protein [Magnetospirillum sp. SS-4]|uniref:radical SAM protein n=1 Tax=Magnetospirillum sp. SS-4 TaxID=2681465 RepID=UPI0013800718|nr:radical SAM protein [Magnetospirillum sp. SS-4]CAA7613746.1 Radical SAM domain protein [Magnetospirillum sp. SS-4]
MRAEQGVSAKFRDPEWTAGGDRRAAVPLSGLETLWFNTGTLCNLACRDCYIESGPRNDRLAYLRRDEARRFLDEAGRNHPELAEIGFTGGEPFMNPDILGMLEDALATGRRTLVLTNAMKPMQRLKAPLLALNRRFPGMLTLRVSVDHHAQARHEELRGQGSWRSMMEGLAWLVDNDFTIAIAGRRRWGETEEAIRDGYGVLFDRLGLRRQGGDLVLFPEMDPEAEVPEISERCWGILGKRPDSVMCATSRMVVRRKEADRPVVLSCTLLAYDPQFEMGATLAEVARPVSLNHRFCAEFCVLGGASCGGGGH